jgi:hypothetical protein
MQDEELCECGCPKDEHCQGEDCCYWETESGAGFCFKCEDCHEFVQKEEEQEQPL